LKSNLKIEKKKKAIHQKNSLVKKQNKGIEEWKIKK
jgi:hypothetical protein